jgi:hypothetical protein
LKLGEGHWKAGGRESYRMQIFDPRQGGIGIEAVIPTAYGPAPMVLRLKVENNLITEVEAIVVYKQGKDNFGAPERLAGTQPSFYLDQNDPSFGANFAIRHHRRDGGVLAGIRDRRHARICQGSFTA